MNRSGPPYSNQPDTPGHAELPGGEQWGDILPQHEVLDFIGRGGMGAVYKARQKSLNRVVAVKLLRANGRHGEGMDFVARFKVEAQAMARLSHPHIVAVHDFGETEDGQLFYVMEFVEGTDLAKRIEWEGKMAAGEAVRIALAVSDALICAHAEGVVHRDIKPSNILLSHDGKIKVADFGLAKMDDPATASLTLSGTSMGSQGYAAPEVFAKAGTADHRADIYSLGVVLYEMLTGDVPRGMFKLPSEKVPGLDPRFDGIICKAMEEDREERFQSVTEMRETLQTLVAPSTSALVPALVRTMVEKPSRADTRAQRRLHWPRVALVAAAVGVVGGFIWNGIDRTHLAGDQAGLQPPANPSPGQWQDVLAKFDLTRHRLTGHWKMINGELTNLYETGSAAVELPIETKGACDLRFKLARISPGAGPVTLAFRIGAHAGQFAISDYGRPRAGLEFIDGKSMADNGAHVENPTAYLPIDHPQEIVLCLRDEGMTVTLDSVEIYRWKGDWARVTQQGDWIPEALQGRKVFAIARHSGRIKVQEIGFRELSDDAGRTLPPEPADAPKTLPLPEPRVFAGTGHRYQYFPGSFIWTEAEANAVSLGGHLATLTSEGENQWVWSTFSKYLPAQPKHTIDNRGWWIGGTKAKEDSPWQWVTGVPFEYTCWAGGTPPPARVPRLRQHDNGGGSGLSAWTPIHYSERSGYLVEWDSPVSAAPPPAPAVVTKVPVAVVEKNPPAPAKSEPGAIDLLALVDLKRDAVRGRWSRQGTDLRVQEGSIAEDGGLPRLQLPYEPKGEYDFEMEFTPLAGTSHVHQLLSADGRSFSWTLDVPTGGGARAGFEAVEGMTLNYRQDGVVVRKKLLTNGQRHRSKVEVRKDQVRGYLDGELLVSWGAGPQSYQDLDMPPYLALRDDRHLGIAAQDRALAIHKIEVREITGKPPLPAVVTKPPTDEELRDFAAWLFSQPASSEPTHAGPNKVPDLLVEGVARNLRKVVELPAKPFSVTRVRTGPLRLDETARKQLDVLSRMPRLYDLRIYGAEDAAALGCVRHRTWLGTLVFKGSSALPVMKDDHLVNLARLTNLHMLRIECWRGFTGQGFAHMKEKRPLDELGLLECPDLTDEGLGEIARFTNLKRLSLTVGAGVTDAGLAKLARLRLLESLFLNFTEGTKTTGSGLVALAGLKQLRSLRLDGAFPGPGLAFVGKLTSLQELQCWHNPSVTDEVLPGLAGLAGLHVLRLDDTKITGRGFAGFKGFANALQLCVDDCYISDEGLRAITDAFPELDSITLSRNKQTFTPGAMATELSRLPKLNRLHCTYKFSDAEMEEVAKLTGLRSLNLQFSDVTDAGLAHLKPLVNLTELQLVALPMTDACIPALKELRGLKSLVLTGTKLTEQGVTQLQQALPLCAIIR